MLPSYPSLTLLLLCDVLLRISRNPYLPNLSQRPPAIPRNEVLEIRVLRHSEVVRPVPEHIVHAKRCTGIPRVAGLLSRIREGESVPALRVEVPLAPARSGVGGAAAALGRVLPVSAVGAGACLEELVGRATEGLREGVRAGR